MVEKRNFQGRVSPSRSGGFSLIEVMIVVAIIGILSAIAYPSYTEYVRRARRADGQAALMAVEAAQARWRVSHTTYTSTLGDLSLSANSADGYYSIAISGNTATSYRATATPVAGLSQASDTRCPTLWVQISTNSRTKGPDGCWKN